MELILTSGPWRPIVRFQRSSTSPERTRYGMPMPGTIMAVHAIRAWLTYPQRP